MERILYPGSFRPFHEGHLEKVDAVSRLYPDCLFIFAVSCHCARSNISTIDAAQIIDLSLKDKGIEAQIIPVKRSILSAKVLKEKDISVVMTGSQSTLKALRLLSITGYWKGEIVQLNNIGIHATQIRYMMENNDLGWKQYLTPSAVSFLESKM